MLEKIIDYSAEIAEPEIIILFDFMADKKADKKPAIPAQTQTQGK